MADYQTVTITAGRGGWGGPLTIIPTDGRSLIYSVTDGGVHPVAARIAGLTGGTAVDGRTHSAPFDQIAVVVTDGASRTSAGAYPMKNVPTVDDDATPPTGPLAQFITAQLFVSGVKVADVAPGSGPLAAARTRMVR